MVTSKSKKNEKEKEMRKFSKILESLESDMVADIKDIFVDLIDKGFEIKVEEGHGVYLIRLNHYTSIDKPLDYMECISDIYVANKRLLDLGLNYVKSDKIMLGERSTNKLYSNIIIRYNNSSSVPSKDVHTWEEFKLYVENVLGVSGIEGKLNDDSYFRIDVACEDGWDVPEYFGWQIGINRDIDNAVETFVAEYPGYEDFLRGVLKRRLDYDALWGHERRKENIGNDEIGNPLKFDKEGIEVVEKLLEMAKKFTNKIRVDKA